MRWLSFGILSAAVVVLQTSVAWRLELGAVRPEWAIVLAVFYLMHAVWADALLAVWIIGFMLDLCSGARLGVFALTFGLSALVILRVRHLFFRENLMAHLFLTLCFGVLVYAGIGVFRVFFYPTMTSVVGAVLLYPLFVGLYAAAWAYPAYWLFQRLRWWMGLRPSDRRRARM